MKITKWQPEIKNFMIGKADVQIETEYGPMIYANIAVFQKDGGQRWASMPQTKTDRLNEQGKPVFLPYIRFDTVTDKEKFNLDFFNILNKIIDSKAPKDEEAPF